MGSISTGREMREWLLRENIFDDDATALFGSPFDFLLLLKSVRNSYYWAVDKIIVRSFR